MWYSPMQFPFVEVKKKVRSFFCFSAIYYFCVTSCFSYSISSCFCGHLFEVWFGRLTNDFQVLSSTHLRVPIHPQCSLRPWPLFDHVPSGRITVAREVLP